MFNLRNYQRTFVANIYAAWQTVRSVLGVLPTRSGKTVCFAQIMHDHVGASAAVVHRKELVRQISMALSKLGVKHRVIAPPKVVTKLRQKQLKLYGRSFVDPHARAGVISVQTLTSASSEKNRELQQWLAQITLAVFDEGHHYVKKGVWARAVELMKNAKLLFVTATPKRADGLGLGTHSDGFADVMVEGPPLSWMIEQGYVCPFKYFAPDTDLDVEGLLVTATGDFNAKALRARVVESHLVGDVVRHYQQFSPGQRALVFATDVATANEIAAAFNAAGIAAAAVNGETNPDERDRQFDMFESGELAVLVNVDLFDEGVDISGADVVILARPTDSLGKYLQMAARPLTPVFAEGYDLGTVEGRHAAIAASGKPYGIIIDMVRNWERHGAPNWPRVWSLDGSTKGSRGPSDTIPQRICLGCTQVYEKFYKLCPYQLTPKCKEVPQPAGRSLPEQVDGDLHELDVEAMAALFAKMQRADMSDEEFALDMAARNVPSIGRGVQLKDHQASRYRRQVLRELVAWWIGMQPADRPLAEKHSRFLYRFGIDIGTAFTLKAAETDKLIERIKQRFAEDIAA